MTPEEIAYIKDYRLVKLAGDGDSALYNSFWGARTISNILEMHELQSIYDKNLADSKTKKKQKLPEMSMSMAIVNERFIEENGFALYYF